MIQYKTILDFDVMMCEKIDDMRESRCVFVVVVDGWLTAGKNV